MSFIFYLFVIIKVAKIVGDHGGVIECDSQSSKTVFRILMPAAPATPIELIQPASGDNEQ